MKKLLSIIALIILNLFLTSCNLTFSQNEIDNTTTNQDVSNNSSTTKSNYRISTKDINIDLYAGETTYIQYTLNFELPEGERLEFTSSNPEVARVLSTGYLIGRSKGKCEVVISYKDVSLTYYVTVSQDSAIEKPDKLTYYVDEELDLSGAEIIYYNTDKTIDKVIEVTNDMVTKGDTSTPGEKEVVVTYNNDKYSFYISVIEREFEPFLLKSAEVMNSSIKTNDKVSFKILPKNMTRLKETINSVYDYNEFKILIDIESPSGKVDTIYAYYNQDYNETRKDVASMNKGRNLEGTVFDKVGKNFELTLSKDGDAYFKGNYVPKEVGTYTYTIRSYSLDTTLIEALGGEFNVRSGNSSKGVIGVSDNKRTFEFEDGSTYIAVGENVAWYTSAQRRYGDFEIIFDELSKNDCSYARVWLSGFSFALFWDDVENYDTRLDEAYELDRMFELAENKGIYINLTIFHHGMFSAKVNPMWPNDVNDWYVNKYGVNPYSKHFSDSGEFFTSQYGKKWCKNYLTYIVARYGYSENLLSYELFNEVDWVESYNASTGAAWHDEMARYIKNIDYRNHMVTTSVKGDDFSSNIYQVFKLDSIDYVNVHNYGSKNYLNVIPKKAQSSYTQFNKPIMYQEVGYNGNSGSDQYRADPNNITLHQELWAGMMSTGSSGMNWWWESWIEVNNCYSYFSAPARFAKMIDLSGDMTLIYGSSKVSNTKTSLLSIGYSFNNKAYIYVYDKNYNVDNYNVSFSSTMTVKIDNGTYIVKQYDTNNMNLIKSEEINASNGSLKVSISGTNDIAVIITKK